MIQREIRSQYPGEAIVFGEKNRMEVGNALLIFLIILLSRKKLAF
jgi:hypothetical protein